MKVGIVTIALFETLICGFVYLAAFPFKEIIPRKTWTSIDQWMKSAAKTLLLPVAFLPGGAGQIQLHRGLETDSSIAQVRLARTWESMSILLFGAAVATYRICCITQHNQVSKPLGVTVVSHVRDHMQLVLGSLCLGLWCILKTCDRNQKKEDDAHFEVQILDNANIIQNVGQSHVQHDNNHPEPNNAERPKFDMNTLNKLKKPYQNLQISGRAGIFHDNIELEIWCQCTQVLKKQKNKFFKNAHFDWGQFKRAVDQRLKNNNQNSASQYMCHLDQFKIIFVSWWGYNPLSQRQLYTPEIQHYFSTCPSLVD